MAPNGLLLRQQSSITEGLRLVDHYYACDYEPVLDLALVFANYRHLGN
jgi:thiamine kinase-like enzyme